VWTELLHPDPASELPIDENHAGSASGNLRLQMYLSTVGGLDAVAEFTFTNFNDTCTNGLTMVDAWQYAPVDVVNYNGNMWGYTDYGALGWSSTALVVTNKHSSGGHWYIKNGASPVAYFNYAQAPWKGCAGCTTPASCLCP
jgi:hypothetical protein